MTATDRPHLHRSPQSAQLRPPLLVEGDARDTTTSMQKHRLTMNREFHFAVDLDLEDPAVQISKIHPIQVDELDHAALAPQNFSVTIENDRGGRSFATKNR